MAWAWLGAFSYWFGTMIEKHKSSKHKLKNKKK